MKDAQVTAAPGRQDLPLSNAQVAIQAARLWPNREHESNALASLLCRAGLHRWKRLDLSQLFPGKDILHCFWCSRVKVNVLVLQGQGEREEVRRLELFSALAAITHRPAP